MCGRYTHLYTWAEVHAFLAGFVDAMFPTEDPAPAYNFAPSQTGWTIAAPQGEGSDAVLPMRWGLIPMWAKDPKIAYSTINARVETASSKPAFRDAWKKRRCLVPASGYYEWKGEGKAKQAWYVQPQEAPLLMFAGLWERWRTPQGEDLLSYSIVTMDAAGPIANLHDRMPLILPPELTHDWIHGDADQAAAIAQAAPDPALKFHPVARAVGNVRNQGEKLIEPVTVEAEEGAEADADDER